MPTLNRVKFVNPVDGSTYLWPLNPGLDAETQNGYGFQQKVRQIEYTSNTGNIGLTRQQGEDGPFIINWTFNIYTQDFQEQLWAWYELSKKQSIYFYDFNAEAFEGQIIMLARMRTGVLSGPGETFQRGFFTTMRFQFDVWQPLSGPLQAAGVV